MERSELIKKTKDAIDILYQNREQEAIRGVSELLNIYQQALQEMAEKPDQKTVLEYIEVLKRLVECFHAEDMLGMADCLYEYMLPILEA